MMKSLVLLVGIFLLSLADSLTVKYARGPLNLGEDASLYYSIDMKAKTASLALVVTSSQLKTASERAWAGIGVSEPTSGSMLGADIASIVFPPGELSKCELSDMYVPFAAYPLRDSTAKAQSAVPEPDKCQDDGSWTLVSCKRDVSKGTITMEVRRSLDANDSQDRAIGSGPQQIIYAYGAGSFKYHGKRRGGSRITLYNEDGSLPRRNELPLPNDITASQNVVASNYTVPSDVVTTYACTAVEANVPKGGSISLVAADPVLKSTKGRNMAHHLLVYACPKFEGWENFLKTRNCNDGQGELGATSKCKGLLFAWAVGVGRFVLPDGVGFELNDNNKYLIMETHYDNPEKSPGAIDASGAKLYYSKPRKTKAGVLILGDSTVSLGGKVVKNQFKYLSTCPSECTKKFKEPINVFGSTLHMHTTGEKIWTNRFTENGTFIENTNAIEYWSNDHQMMVEYSPPRKINPGDKLATTCIYDTRKRPKTKFGPETKDEMCMDFLFYYPAQKLTKKDDTIASCGMFLAPNTTKLITTCGAPAFNKEAFLPIPNPSFNDTTGTPSIFGKTPARCALAESKAEQSPKAGTPEQSSEPVCFPAEATAQLRDGSRRRMDELALGDEVLVGNGQFSKVFAFTHRHSNSLNNFVTLHTKSRRISLTPSHLIYANGQLVPAGRIRIGDVLHTEDGTEESVSRIFRSRKVGLYNPQTLHGDIVVNGIVASTYTTEVQSNAAHALLAPLRVIARYTGWYLRAFEGDFGSTFAWKTARPFLTEV